MGRVRKIACVFKHAIWTVLLNDVCFIYFFRRMRKSHAIIRSKKIAMHPIWMYPVCSLMFWWESQLIVDALQQERVSWAGRCIWCELHLWMGWYREMSCQLRNIVYYNSTQYMYHYSKTIFIIHNKYYYYYSLVKLLVYTYPFTLNFDRYGLMSI